MGLLLAPYCRGTLLILPRYRPEDALAPSRGTASRCSPGSPTSVRRPDGPRGASPTTDFAVAAALLLRRVGAARWRPCARWEAATGCTVCEGYGQSEAGPVLTFNPRDGVRKQGSVGVPLPLTEVQIVDTETGTRTLAPNEPGEIRARGPQIMSGYRNRPEETAAALARRLAATPATSARSTRTATCSSSTARRTWRSSAASMSIRARSRRRCARHPSVAEAAVIGVPDSYRGEALIGYVVLRQPDASDPSALTTCLAERLTRYKISRDILIVRGVAQDGRRQDRQGCAEGVTPG